MDNKIFIFIISLVLLTSGCQSSDVENVDVTTIENPDLISDENAFDQCFVSVEVGTETEPPCSKEKMRDSSRRNDLSRIMVAIEEARINGESIPETSCSQNLTLNYLDGVSPVDPRGQGPDDSITSGFDCSGSYFYTNEVKGINGDPSEFVYGVYAKLELPSGNIDCENLGTDAIIEARGLIKNTGYFCYVALMSE